MLNIVFISYNCGSDIASVIGQIINSDLSMEDVFITVVDNASTDDSVKILKSLKDVDINVIESESNLGFGAGCNIAFENFNENGRTLLLNPDVSINSNSISELNNFADKYPDSGIWGGVTLDSKGQSDGKNVWKEPSLLGVFSWALFGDVLLKKMGRSIPDAYSDFELKGRTDVDAITGCFFLIDNRLLKCLKGFDERFFMYSEEIDLCRRARELGAQPRFTHDAVIIHEGSGTINSINKLRFLFKSKLLYADKYWSFGAFFMARSLIFIGSLLRLSIFSIISIVKSEYKNKSSLWFDFLIEQIKWKF